MTFDQLGLEDSLLEALSYMNFTEATPIQEQAIPPILDNRDIIGCAQTGTGKTAAFILPILQKIQKANNEKSHTLILVPTRELAMQVDQQIQGLAYFTNASSVAVYGGGDGNSFDQEKKALTLGADIVIATPGRLISHMNSDYVDFSDLSCLILDEADRMLDIGFYDDIIRIFKKCNPESQRLLFSATMAPRIRKLAKEILNTPVEINLAVSKPAEKVEQEIYLCFEENKRAIAKHIIERHADFSRIIVFCSTKKSVEKLYQSLQRKGFNCEAVSSDYSQDAREKILLDFKSKKLRIVVATDVLSRGIDIKDIDMVLNFDVPNDAEDYVHRVGRTARAANEGLAITLVSENEMNKFHRIEKFIGREFEKLAPPENLGKMPEWKVFEKKRRKKFYKKKKKPTHSSNSKSPKSASNQGSQN